MSHVFQNILKNVFNNNIYVLIIPSFTRNHFLKLRDFSFQINVSTISTLLY